MKIIVIDPMDDRFGHTLDLGELIFVEPNIPTRSILVVDYFEEVKKAKNDPRKLAWLQRFKITKLEQL